MQEALEQLKLAFNLMEADLESGSVYQRVASEVGRFLLKASGGDPGAFTGGLWGGSLLPPLEDGELFEVQHSVALLLNTVAAGAVLSDHERQVLTVTAPLVPLVDDEGRVVITAAGSIRDRYLLTLVFLLRHVGAGRVLRCRCGRAFLKVGPRKYCSDPECKRQRDSDYWQEYKHTPSGKEVLRRFYEKHGWTLGGAAKTHRHVGPLQGTTKRDQLPHKRPRGRR